MNILEIYICIELCHVELYQTLCAKNSALMKEVEFMVKELTRITVLWEEHWLLFLHQLQSEVASRLRSSQCSC
jgi:hypothetical protein